MYIIKDYFHVTAVWTKKKQEAEMTKQKIGRKVLLSGILLLLIALLLLFNTTSPWALITLTLSVLVNTVGVSFLMIK